MIRHVYLRILTKAVTVRRFEPLLKRLCHGHMAKLDCHPAFDEPGRIQMSLDFAKCIQCRDRPKNLMAQKVMARLDAIPGITCFKALMACVT